MKKAFAKSVPQPVIAKPVLNLIVTAQVVTVIPHLINSNLMWMIIRDIVWKHAKKVI